MSENKERYKIIIVLFIVGSFILLANLFVLQLMRNDFRTQAQNRTLTKRTLVPSRGVMTDRRNELIVINEPAYELQIVVSELSKEMDTAFFCKLLDISIHDFEGSMEDLRKKTYFRKNLPIRFLNNIDPLTFSIFQEHLYQFPGFYPVVQDKRAYPYANAAHVLGFLGEVNSEDLVNHPGQYESGDYRGITGIERTYDTLLRGIKGLEFLLKDNLGREIESYMEGTLDTMAISGRDIQTSLDISLQAYGEELFKNKRGSIVAIQPSTGEVLAMISSPSYNPNALSKGRQRNITYLELLQDTINKPLFNRSLQAKYPPGSIFKAVLSLIALQEEIAYPRRSMTCTGEYVINKRQGYVQGCRSHPPPKDLSTALQYSCNSYFFQIIREFIDQFGVNHPEKGLALLNDYLSVFGLGRPLGIDLLNEGSGFIPTPAFYDKVYLPSGDRWRSTYILSIGIGQGEMELTTLQMANLAVIIANRGFYYTPHLLKSAELLDNRFKTKRNTGIDSIHFTPVIEGMQRVIDSGTGRRASVQGIEICGKTGTSQNPHGSDHSVFFGFAPRNNPKIALAVYVENAGSGGSVASPIGGLMIEKYLKGNISKGRQFWDHYVKDLQLISNP